MPFARFRQYKKPLRRRFLPDTSLIVSQQLT